MAETNEFTVSGMTCGHCETSVREEVQDIAGVTRVDVSHQTGKLVVTSETSIGLDAVVQAVEEAGYQAVPV